MKPEEKIEDKHSALETHYGPLGPRDVIAAAMALRPRDDQHEKERKAANDYAERFLH